MAATGVTIDPDISGRDDPPPMLCLAAQLSVLFGTHLTVARISVALKSRARLAAVWSFSVLSFSLLERGLFRTAAAVKDALLLGGEAKPWRRGAF